MDKIEKYDIIFSGLANGVHEFEFEIKEAFFLLFKTDQEFENPNIKVIALLEKHSSFMELSLKVFGKVELTCDISNEKFDFELNENSKYLVKFGEEFDSSYEEIIVIPRDAYFLNIAQVVYDNIVLSIPMKKTSPNLEDRHFSLLEKYSPQEKETLKEEEQSSDPRWDALKKLKK